jgi:hypothetical protein
LASLISTRAEIIFQEAEMRAIAIKTAIILAALWMFSCGGNQDIQGSSTLLEVLPQIQSQLPAMPGLDDSRAASDLIPEQLDPQIRQGNSPGVSEQGDDLLLDSTAGGFEWVMYSYNPGMGVVKNLKVTLGLSPGEGAFVGLANYASSRWEFGSKITTEVRQFNIAEAAGKDYTGLNGSVHFIVVSYDNEDVLVTDLEIVSDVVVPKFAVSGTIQNAAQDPVQGVLVTLTPGNLQGTTNASGSYNIANVPKGGGYTLTPTKAGLNFDPATLFIAELEGNLAGRDFMALAGPPPTWTADIFPLIDGQTGEFRCLNCHSGPFPEADHDWSVYTEVRDNADKIIDRTNRNSIAEGRMPKEGDKWSQSNLDLFQAWVDGGMLEN